MTTGIGCWLMSLCRNVIPSMRGISTSSVMTSGISREIRSAAMNGSAAVPITSMPGSEDRMSESVCRTTAESSTIRTFTFLGMRSSSFRLSAEAFHHDIAREGVEPQLPPGVPSDV